MSDEDIIEDAIIALVANGFSDEAIDFARTITRRDITVAERDGVHMDAEESAMWADGSAEEDVADMYEEMGEVIGKESDDQYSRRIDALIMERFRPHRERKI